MEKRIEVFGPIERNIVIINGKEVPDISVRNDYDSDVVTFVLDINSHAIDIPRNLAEGFILFVADAMVQGAGYSSFGNDHKHNKFNRSITVLTGMDVDDLVAQGKEGEK